MDEWDVILTEDEDETEMSPAPDVRGWGMESGALHQSPNPIRLFNLPGAPPGRCRLRPSRPIRA